MVLSEEPKVLMGAAALLWRYLSACFPGP